MMAINTCNAAVEIPKMMKKTQKETNKKDKELSVKINTNNIMRTFLINFGFVCTKA